VENNKNYKDIVKVEDKDLSSYLVIVDKKHIVVLGENIADVCDKLELSGIEKYEFVFAKSLPMIY